MSIIGFVVTKAEDHKMININGNIYQAGLTYGGNEIITKSTGKSMAQNIKEGLVPKKEDSDFQKLVKRNIEKTRKKLNLSNQ